jgi:tRNA threonylcarbamoyladenosine biosynthesis protein TsaE
MTGPPAETRTTRGPEETESFGAELAARLRPGDCVALVGPLGAGKTALVRGIARGLGVDDPAAVASPTYVLVHEYDGPVPVYHIDLYRMADPDAELADLGLDEMLADGVVLIEWADRTDAALPRPRWHVAMAHAGPTSRRIELTRS